MGQQPLRAAFMNRKDRYRLLDEGVLQSEFGLDSRLLEVGCGDGGATIHLSRQGYTCLTAVDLDDQILSLARAEAPECNFLTADVVCLPFPQDSFDGIFSEAAFSVLADQSGAVREYARILRPGGRLLLHDFALLQERETENYQPSAIPMLCGVGTMDQYQAMFERNGFRCVERQDRFAELVRIAMSLSRAFRVEPKDIGAHLAETYGKDPFVHDFFAHSRMSYCQMIFER